jgi:PAS domain S-box-containing protein
LPSIVTLVIRSGFRRVHSYNQASLHGAGIHERACLCSFKGGFYECPKARKDTQLTESKLKGILTPSVKNTASGNPSRGLTQKLIASEKWFQFVVQTATDAIILWDEHGTILFWNKGAHLMFGYAAEEIVGKPLILIMPVRYHEAHYYGMGRVGIEGEGQAIVKTVEMEGLRKNGEEFPKIRP